jgi:PKD repeat protein
MKILPMVAVVAMCFAACGEPPPAEQAPPATAPAAQAPATQAKEPLVAWIEESEPESGPPPLAVKFTSVVRGGTPPYTYRWDFGDRTETSSEPLPVHTFMKPGEYATELYVTDAGGDEDEDSTVIEVIAPGKAG